MWREDTLGPRSGAADDGAAVTLAAFRTALANAGIPVRDLDRLDDDGVRLVYSDGVDGAEAKIVGAYAGLHSGDQQWRAAVQGLGDVGAAGESLSWAPDTLHATCVAPDVDGPGRAFSWRLEAAWAERLLADAWTEAELLARVEETLEGPHPFDADGE